MAKKTTVPVTQKRKPRLLWANPFCLLDSSSGASMTVRKMLLQLVEQGCEVQVLGATVFDSLKGIGKLKEQFSDIHANLHELIEAEDGALTHQLLVTYSTNRNHLTAHEADLWYGQYRHMLDSFKPDVVWFYGGQTLDLLIADEARSRGIPTAFYLANGNYKASRWCRDIDLILTDSHATAAMYRKSAGFAATPIGKFIDPETFIAPNHARKRLLYVNPSWAKGASIVVQLALELAQIRPDIELEVVEARADWSRVLRDTTCKLGQEQESLPNVVVTPNTSDMREPYSRARVLLAPSLWWESSGRVLAEAMLNSIPALITNRGGMPEMIDDAGLAFDFPEACYEAPYQHLLTNEELKPLLNAVIAFYDDEALYQAYVERAKRVGEKKHNIDNATQRLMDALSPLAKQRAGNKDFTVNQKKRHRQNLVSVGGKPEFKVDASFVRMVQGNRIHAKASKQLLATVDFDWQIKGKVVVLDNRAKLLKSGTADKLANTNAFTILAFDPASEIANPNVYQGNENIQLFQHALLGDGLPTKLNICLDAGLSSPLTPLPEIALPKHRRQSTKVLTQLPMNTVALDSIQGLPSLDWLILDDLSDACSILAHGEKVLKETLLIQARVAFQPTHEKQPSLAELQHWASHNGFRFYRFNDIHHHSHIPESIGAKERPATEQESADVLFLPSQERMAVLSDHRKLKLAFLLSTVFEANDVAYELVNEVDSAVGKKYLIAQGLLELKSQVPPPAGPPIPQSGHVEGEPLVSVICVTYNHCDFIEDAINGFVSQKTNFPFEVIIHDDASTDGTQDIIRKYAEKYPTLIRPIYQKENQYSQNKKPLNICLPIARGKYIAWCDGDDYWTDINKLQVQFDYMEKTPSCVVTHHNAFIFRGGELLSRSKLSSFFTRDFSALELVKNDCFVLMVSMMFRKVVTVFPKEKSKIDNGDNFLISILGLYGESKYLAEIKPAGYRSHENSIWSSKSVHKKNDMQANSLLWIGRYHARKGRRDVAMYYELKAKKLID